MNKADMIEYMAQEAGLTKADAERALQAFVKGVAHSLTKKEPVVLVGFGTFDTKDREAHMGRNPQTGKAIKINASTRPVFKAGKALKDAVNEK